MSLQQTWGADHSPADASAFAKKLLNAGAVFCLLMMIAGQWMFALYVAIHYGGTALQGDFAAWSQGGTLGIVPGDTWGNAAMAAHVFLALLVLVGGPLQLLPWLRSRAPAFHRWNGRVYMASVVVASVAGLYMTWVRDSSGPLAQDLGVSIGGVLTLVFAALALNYAVKRDITHHRRWALRLFIVASAVWFFRIGLMAWILINGGPVGIDTETFTGPLLNVLAYAQYLVPLAVLELYLHARERGGSMARMSVGGGLVALTLLMGTGIFGALMGLWLPLL